MSKSKLTALCLVASVAAGLSAFVMHGTGAADSGPAPCVCSRPVGATTVQIAPGRTELKNLDLYHCKCDSLDCAYSPGAGLSCK